MTTLTEYDLARYHRQMLIPGWGEAGQAKIKAARVFIAGAGGLGGPVSIYLAAAGVGEIRICDADVVELSNLNRQILHSDRRVGESKAASAEITLREVNPSIRVLPRHEYLDRGNVDDVVGKPDVILDCLDNLETRYLLNAYGITHNVPLVHGAIWGMTGQVSFIHPPETPCLRCIIPEAPPKETFPVVGVTPGLTGCIQALEALKFITGVGTTLKGRLLTIDGEFMKFSTLNLRRVHACPDCGASAPPEQRSAQIGTTQP